MTYGMLRKRICGLLDLETEASPMEGSIAELVSSLMSDTVSAVTRKVSLCLKFYAKEVLLRFDSEGAYAVAALPEDYLSAKSLRVGGKRYGTEQMEAVGGKLMVSQKGITEGVLTYYAYPMLDCRSGDTILPFGDAIADLIAYGVAAELCHAVYPEDMKRYMRLATEFDERMLHDAPRSGEQGVANTFFGRRGIGV